MIGGSKIYQTDELNGGTNSLTGNNEFLKIRKSKLESELELREEYMQLREIKILENQH